MRNSAIGSVTSIVASPAITKAERQPHVAMISESIGGTDAMPNPTNREHGAQCQTPPGIEPPDNHLGVRHSGLRSAQDACQDDGGNEGGKAFRC